jgi:signal transduction histidine kinase/ActR/RegA family two-component response regulator
MSRFRTPNLRALATVAAAAVVAGALLMGPVLFFGAFALRTTLIDLNTRNDRDRQETADLAATVIEGGMASRAEQLNVLATRDDFVDAVALHDTARLQGLLAPSVAGLPDVVTAGALDESGKLIGRYPVDPTVLGQNLGDRDYFVAAVRSTKTVVGSIVTSRLDPSLVVVPVAIAVRQDGVLRGVIALTIRPAVLLTELNKVQNASGRELVIVDGNGGTVASTGGRTALGKLGLPPTDVGTAPVDGQARAFVSAKIDGTGWRLYVLDDVAAIYAAQRQLTSELGLPLMGAIFAAGILAAILAAGWTLLARSRQELRVANDQLTDMNASVQAATRAKSDFLANMSHELRTPLNAVLGFSDVLLEQLRPAISDRQARYLTNIHAAGAHLLELINDVLDLSKVEAGRLVLRPDLITLPTLLEPVIASTAQLAMDRGVRFEMPDVPSGNALVDAARVRQVLLNLLSNAVKFSHKGGSVRFLVSTPDADLRFDVIDEGIGIPADKRARVFGVFERLHEGVADASGTGLGLAITKKLVELQHGTIDFESEAGKGTHFWVILEDVVIGTAALGPRVLVVDDDPGDAELLASVAREAGHRVETAPNAAIALAAIARSLPTAVILDLRLPDRRGDDVLRALKADPMTAHIPVLVVTVEDDDGHLRPLGAADHLTKPVDRAQLRRWLAQVGAGSAALARAAG